MTYTTIEQQKTDRPPYRVKADVTLQFIRQHKDRLAWDVSIQSPFRKLLGRIEETQHGWKVINIERETHSDRNLYNTYMEATEHLRQLIQGKELKARVAELKAA